MNFPFTIAKQSLFAYNINVYADGKNDIFLCGQKESF